MCTSWGQVQVRGFPGGYHPSPLEISKGFQEIGTWIKFKSASFGKESKGIGFPLLECPQMGRIFQSQQVSSWSLRRQSAVGEGEGRPGGRGVLELVCWVCGDQKYPEMLKEKGGAFQAETLKCHLFLLILDTWRDCWNSAHFALLMCDI